MQLERDNLKAEGSGGLTEEAANAWAAVYLDVAVKLEAEEAKEQGDGKTEEAA